MRLGLTILLLGALLAPRSARADDPPVVVVGAPEPGRTPSVDVTPAEAPEVEDDEPVTVEVRAPDAVDPQALRAALERDLGVRVELVSDGGARVIVDLLRDGVVRLRVRRADGELTRHTDPVADPERAAAAVSLLISNLVRDESGEVLAMLRVEVADPAPTEPAPTEEPAPVEVAPEPVEVPPAPEPVEPAVERVPFGIDFAPLLGMSTALVGTERRAFSLGVVGALHAGSDGFSGSSVLDLGVGEVRGAQVSGVLSLATGGVRGVQASGVLSLSGGDVRGLQLGVVDVAAGELHGLQGGVLDVAGPVEGAQLGVLTVAGPVDGAQLGVVNVAAGEVRGAQLGLVNVASGRVHGLQLGLVNVSEDADAAVGLINVHARGRTQLRFGLDTNGYIDANLVHGGRYTHTVVRVAALPFLERPHVALGLGFGARVPVEEILHVDVELTANVLLDEDSAQDGPDMLYEARALVGFAVVDELGLYFGLAYRLHLARDPTDVEVGAPVLEHELARGDRLLLRGWPALIGGVELF